MVFLRDSSPETSMLARKIGAVTSIVCRETVVSEVLKAPGTSRPWYAETIDWRSSDPHAVLKIGIPRTALRKQAERGQAWSLGQMYGVLQTGLINVEHIFQGLRRRMCVEDDMTADAGMYAFIWTPRHDARMTEDGTDYERVAAPPNAAFFVHVSPNRQLIDFPEIFGWAERWGWVDLSPLVSPPLSPPLLGAPIDWQTRYDRRLWSRR
jgi:hypothetical protein